MRTLGSYFFVFLYLLAMYRPVAPLFNYISDIDYIAEFLCINKDQPELNCNGKCYLMQMLEEQEKDRHQNVPKINVEDYPIGFIEFLNWHGNILVLGFDTKRPNYSNFYNFLFLAASFHPPNNIS